MDLTDEQLDALCGELRDQAMAFRVANPTLGKEPFRIDPRGGLYSIMRKGRVQDSYVAKTASEEAENFCEAYDLPYSFWCDVKKYESDENCHQLAKAWKHRMSYFYKKYQDNPRRFVDIPEMKAHAAEYNEPEELLTWERLGQSAVVCKRLEKVRDIFRKYPGGGTGAGSSGDPAGSPIRHPNYLP